MEEEEGEEGEEEGEGEDLQLTQSGVVGELLLSQHLFCLLTIFLFPSQEIFLLIYC